MTAAPLISVMLPVYNAALYVGQCVESILAQTLGDFELIVIDDGSTDTSRQVLEGYAARDGRVRLFSRPNTGYVVALNEAIGHARGQLLARMDADDVAMPPRFERQAGYLREHPEVVAVGAQAMMVDPQGWPIDLMGHRVEHDEIERELLSGRGRALLHPLVMMRAEAVRRVGPYRPEFGPSEDLDLFLRLAEVGRLANLDEVLLHYRLHPASVSHTDTTVKLVARKSAVLRAAHERRGLPPPPIDEQSLYLPPDPRTLHAQWARQALGAGHAATARKHARKALATAPFSVASWRLLLRSYLPGALVAAVRKLARRGCCEQ